MAVSPVYWLVHQQDPRLRSKLTVEVFVKTKPQTTLGLFVLLVITRRIVWRHCVTYLCSLSVYANDQARLLVCHCSDDQTMDKPVWEHE